MIIFFHKTGEMNGSSYVKNPLRSSVMLSIQNFDKNCLVCSVLVYLHPIADSRNDHPKRVSNYRHFMFDLNIQGFDSSNKFNCFDVRKFEKLNNLS